ncbi:MAG: hypothetical protein VX589_00050 [Myxococcota bacterium]|nr:hypothetical protein [Myxococcota bacterium]
MLFIWCAGCSDDVLRTETSHETAVFEGDKADSVRGPIASIRCDATESFVRRGGFAEISIEAHDQQGRLSKNYELVVEPAAGHRVVQRNKVIFDEDGSYTVRCCARDSENCDELAIQVGELAPALTLSLPAFGDGPTIRIEGRTRQRGENPAKLSINGKTVAVDAEGRFRETLPIEGGLNVFKLVAQGDDGQQTVRHGWTMGGPFGVLGERDAASGPLLQLALGQSAYPQLARIVKALVVREVAQLSNNERFRTPQQGSQLGYQWTMMPTSVSVSDIEMTFEAGPGADQMTIIGQFPSVLFLADAETRAGSGDWHQRKLQATAQFTIMLTVGVRDGLLQADNLQVNLRHFELEISDLPGFFEDILEIFLRGTVKNTVHTAVEKAVEKALLSIVQGFDFSHTLPLPAPLQGELELGASLHAFHMSQGGLVVDMNPIVFGLPEPDRETAPGTHWSSASLSSMPMQAPYEAQFHLNYLNGVLFEAWRSGGLNFTFVQDEPIAADGDEYFKTERLTLFMNPHLPPLLGLGERPGEVVLEFGAMHIDGVLESELGNWNSSIVVGGRARASIRGDATGFEIAVATESLEADVLIAPAGLEREATRRLLAHVIAKKVLPELLDVLTLIRIPSADLSGLQLPGITWLVAGEYDVEWGGQDTLSLRAILQLQ